MYSVIFIMENQQGPAGQLRELCSMSDGSLDGRGVWGRMDTCICTHVHFTIHLKLSQHCLLISYTLIQNKKLKKKKDKYSVSNTSVPKHGSRLQDTTMNKADTINGCLKLLFW